MICSAYVNGLLRIKKDAKFGYSTYPPCNVEQNTQMQLAFVRGGFRVWWVLSAELTGHPNEGASEAVLHS